MNSIISLKHLAKSYGSNRAVDDLSLDIERGEFFGFLGPNGAGKTTTIRMLTGMIPSDEGNILIEGKSIEQREEITPRVSVMPESPGQYGWMTAQEYLAFFADLYRLARKEQRSRIPLLLKLVSLAESGKTPIGGFSRGMKQRLALARSLINHPRILILDEPTLGLDPQGQEDIQMLLRGLHDEGVTIFLSSHLLPEVSRLCSRIGIIHKGKLVAAGTMEELRKTMGLQEGYFLRIRAEWMQVKQLPVLQHLKKVQTEGKDTNFIFEGSSEEANTLLDELRRHGLRILEFRPQTADLTDIFLSVTRS